MRNILTLILLISIGVIVHYPSFSLSLYGDDWVFIHKYLTHYDPSFHINTMLPGIFKYLAPYGSSVFLIGKEYQIFGQNYFFYYLVALIFKIFASFALLILIKAVTKSMLISLLVATLFLVGFTGIQTTDWVFYSNVYLAVGFFFLGLFFQIKFYEDNQRKNLLSHFIFSLLAIITAPIRLYPLIFIVPFIDLIMFSNQRRIYFSKFLFFILIVIFLWLIGLFGAPGGRIYSPGNWSISDFINFVATQPLFTIKSFFYWIGAIFIPDSLVSNQRHVASVGFVFVITTLLLIITSKLERRKLILAVSVFSIFFLTIWFFSPNRLIGSADRYLLPTFASACFLVGILVDRLIRGPNLSKYFGYLSLAILIILHISATRGSYDYLLSKGRSSDFIKTMDKQIIKDFPSPITQPTIVYLEADDESIKHSAIFGLAFKITVLSKTWNGSFIPNSIDDKSTLINQMQSKVNQGVPKDQIISSIYAYKLRGKDFFSITKQIRDELYSFK